MIMLVYTIYGWFGMVIRENRSGVFSNSQVDRSFRWAMCWFIFSEVMFFGAFFGAVAIGYLDEHVGGFRYGFGFIGMDLLVAAILCLLLNPIRRPT